MSENEIKILLLLNKSRSQNNVSHVISEELDIPKYDVEQAIDSLLQKGYIYEDSNTNQINEGLRAWKITHDGERKVNELKTKESAKNPIASSINDDNKELITQNYKLQNALLEAKIPNEKSKQKDAIKLVLLGAFVSIISTLVGIIPTIIKPAHKKHQVEHIALPSCYQIENKNDSIKLKDTLIKK